MGCGTSANQCEDVSPPKIVNTPIEPVSPNQINPSIKSNEGLENPKMEPEVIETKKQEDRATTAATEDLKHEAMKHVPQGKAFIFGQSQNQRKILMLDCEKMQFSIISSKMQAPAHKYTPKDIIFQESQEMLASNLFNNNSHPPYNFMFVTFLNDETIFLCGGVNYKFDYFSEEAFLFRVASITAEQSQVRNKKRENNLVGNKFQKLGCMREKRYSHMGAHFKIGKLGYVFIFGGRNEDDQLLNSCEQYSLEEKKWRQVTPMPTPRSTGFSLIFRSKIYVFGGYSADKKRSKTIDIYDPLKNYWEQLNVKIHRGIEAGLIFSIKPNQILLMGGNTELGPLKSVIRINLADQTYIWDSNTKNDRLLQKGVKFNETIYIFGGDFQDNFERYGVKDHKWRDHMLSYNEYVSIDDINSYQMATETLEVNFDQALMAKSENVLNDFERYHIFGNDHFPCILELNLNKWVLKKKTVPMALRLRSHMGVAKIMQGKYFICGGIDSMGEKASKASYIYYAGTNKAIEVGKMNSKKYNFAICATQKFVYIFGGKNQAGQIFNECQKYSLEQQKWITLPDLPTERAGAKALVVGSKVLLFGGNDTLQSLSNVDIFDTETDTFWNSSISLSISSQIKAVFIDPKEGTPAAYIFSHNQILNKNFCHYLPLNIPAKNQDIVAEYKIEDDFLQIKNIEEKQLNIKVQPFCHAFCHNGKFNFITTKGLFNWTPTADQVELKSLDTQIVINQVEMLQFPIERFSSI